MAFNYTRSQFISRINAGIQGRIGLLIDKNETANAAVREVLSEINLRTVKRQSALAPKLFNGQFDYGSPSDIQGDSFIDVPPQVKRADGQWFLVTAEEFDRNKNWVRGMIALDTFNGVSVLKIASSIQDYSITLSSLDALTAGGGTWTATGDLTALSVDTDDYLLGAGSLKGNIGTGGTTTAGIKNIALNPTNITTYLGGNGAVFVYVKINDITNLTSYTLRLGSSTSNYYSKTVTVQNNGAAFVNGWNLLRFDLTSLTTTGTPTNTAITYCEVFMTKTTGKISESDYKFDAIVLNKGSIYNIRYYSKFGWNTSAGAWLENSTSDSDVLAADTSEYDLFVLKGRIVANIELKEWDVVKQLQELWEKRKAEYQMSNVDESIVLTSEYYTYEQRDTLSDRNSRDLLI